MARIASTSFGSKGSKCRRSKSHHLVVPLGLGLIPAKAQRLCRMYQAAFVVVKDQGCSLVSSSAASARLSPSASAVVGASVVGAARGGGSADGLETCGGVSSTSPLGGDILRIFLKTLHRRLEKSDRRRHVARQGRRSAAGPSCGIPPRPDGRRESSSRTSVSLPSASLKRFLAASRPFFLDSSSECDGRRPWPIGSGASRPWHRPRVLPEANLGPPELHHVDLEPFDKILNLGMDRGQACSASAPKMASACETPTAPRWI